MRTSVAPRLILSLMQPNTPLHISLPPFVSHAYFMTSSARIRSDGGIVIPSA